MYSQKKNLVAFLFLFLLVLFAYSTNYLASWHFDDYPNLLDNPKIHVNDFKLKNFKEALFGGYDEGQYLDKRMYRPVPMLTFALNWYIGKDNVFGYHIVNNFIHLLTTFFLFLTVLNLLMSPNLKGKYQGSEYAIAFLSAILWAVNPIQTQAVTYLVQRMASFGAMFYIIGIYFYLKTRLSAPGSKRFLFIAGCLLSFVLAYGSKENTVTFPIAVAMIEVLFFQDLKDKNNRKRVVGAVTISGIFLVAILTILYVKGYIPHILKAYENRMFTLQERLMTEPRIIMYYLSQIFYPIASRFSLVHDIKISTSLLKPWTTIPSIFAIILLLGIGFSQIIKRPIIALGIFFFFMNHIIESTAIPLELVFEHRNYLPSLFFFFPVSTGLIWLVNYFKEKNPLLQKLLAVSIAGVILSFCAGTIVRNRAWATEKSLWEDCIAKAPGMARPYHNLAYYHYRKIGDNNKAMEFYKRSLTKRYTHTKTGYALTYNSMATIYYEICDYKSSIKYFKKALEIQPHYPNASYNLTMVYVRTGRFSNALQSVDRLFAECKGSKSSSDALQTKGLVLLTAGRLDEAISNLKSALDINAGNEKAHMNMGVALSLKGEYKKADIFLKNAYRLSPKDIFVHFARIENSVRSGNKENTDHFLSMLLESFDKNTIIQLLKRLDKNNIIAPLSQKLLVEAMKTKMPVLANINLEAACFEKP